MPETSLSDAFIAALQALTDWLNAERVPYTAIGGVAVSLIAQPRATQDIDVLIWLEETRWETFLRAGESCGFVSRISEPLEFARRARVFLYKHQSSGVSADISCASLEFEREMIERSTTLAIGPIVLRMPTPEDLIITKAVAHRPRDLADIESILSVHQNVDASHIRHWIEEFSRVLEMPELQAQVERLLQHSQAPGGS